MGYVALPYRLTDPEFFKRKIRADSYIHKREGCSCHLFLIGKESFRQVLMVNLSPLHLKALFGT